jgi:flagellar motor switch protein FliN/FliY
MNTKSSWTKQVIDAVDHTLGNYSFGKSPTFDLDGFTEQLKPLFPNQSIQLDIHSQDYVKADQVLKSAGANPTIISLELAPISSPIFLSISAEDIQTLTLLLLSKEMKNSFHETELLKGFFRFFFIEVLKIFKLFNPYEGLSLRLSDQPFSIKESYCIELSLGVENIRSMIRLIIPVEFQKLFAQFYEKRKIPLKDRLNFSSITLELQLSLGSSVIKKEELDQIKIGDLLILDHSSYHPKTKKGHFKLSYKNLPLFQVKLKEDQLKILDFIAVGEETYMDDIDDMDDMDEIGDIDDEMMEEDSFTAPVEEKSTESLINPSKIEMTIVCEIGKFEMNLEHLLELKPGSTIPLSKRPEDGVYLTLNQKKIAKGEVVQLGDIIGVKILETY